MVDDPGIMTKRSAGPGPRLACRVGGPPGNETSSTNALTAHVGVSSRNVRGLLKAA